MGTCVNILLDNNQHTNQHWPIWRQLRDLSTYNNNVKIIKHNTISLTLTYQSAFLTMTKKKPPSQKETLKPPMIPRNAKGRCDTRESGFITGWLKNRKQGASLKISQKNTTNKKRKGTHTILSPPLAKKISTATASVTTAANAAKGVSKNSRVLYSKPAQKKLHKRINTKIGKLNPSNQCSPVPSKQN